MFDKKSLLYITLVNIERKHTKKKSGWGGVWRRWYKNLIKGFNINASLHAGAVCMDLNPL